MSAPRPRIRRRVRKVAIVNQKGGVGKSTTTINIACALVEMGARVLIRDMDPQANTTISLAPLGVQYTMNDVLRPDEATGEVVEGCLASAIVPAGERWPGGLYLVPATLVQAEREVDQAVGREQRLAVASTGAVDAFDVVLDDCPPSVGQLTVNALTDDDEVLIITEPEFWPIQGVHQARRTIKVVTRYYNPRLRFAGIIVNGVRTGRVEHGNRLAELQHAYPGEVWDPVVPDLEVIRRAIGAASPLSAFGAESGPARGLYTQFAQRLIKD